MKSKAKKEIKITSQINNPLIIFILVLAVFDMVFLFFYTMSANIADRYESADRLASYIAKESERYRSLGFLIPYWEEHAEELDKVYHDAGTIAEKQLRLNELCPSVSDPMMVTAEQAAGMNEEAQKLFAEICFSRLSTVYSAAKQAYQPMYLYSFDVQGEEIHFLITGTRDDEKRLSEGGDVFELGQITPLVKGWYPVLDKILETGQPVSEMELSLQRGADRSVVHAFSPVYVDGKIAMVIGVSVQWRDLILMTVGLSLFVMIISVLLFTALGIWIYYLLRKVVTKPIHREQEIIRAYEENKDTKEAVAALATIDSGNEIQTLAGNFSSMLTEMDRYVDEIQQVTSEKERMGTELDIATSIQAAMLPVNFSEFSARAAFEVFASMKPAREVGGDFYDFFMIDDDHAGFVIADVSDKGVPASLVMVIVKTLIKTYAMAGNTDPAEIFRRVNNAFCEENREMLFVTAWMGILTLSDGTMVCANAGHEYPMLRRAGGRFELYTDEHDLPLGILEDTTYSSYTLQLSPGDAIFTYTDGAPDAMRADGGQFKEERILDALNEAPDSPPEELDKRIHARISEFVAGAEQFDDTTMLCVVYDGPAQK